MMTDEKPFVAHAEDIRADRLTDPAVSFWPFNRKDFIATVEIAKVVVKR